ncbi:methylenetetrahydrofolate dehydrogenase/methylenetetrahydrofolate cyclohydrolase [Spiroplasma sp. TIUS-1]|uniref:bifunctional 5,10-methylenetetrahydrofolate dehydrogenase/5,10-methenyltetrahydrofolate cyclohydrolase n=1 Tax=Spiroplasma sp. TIUS-1 TaxID=216963 RepID=UPI001397F5E6|nr:bifunctional 5,10-methylenetetrahydrofolate dehydrogenase/5,10-methenyltetrahydrofolate cyclohydrolase [Spiroplasma sp. TIUS-1]QHX35688.1 methylenetetrahydrofolate dehydrogenase/methylenetetrahydrofolate cyclohydrolase [Spiroplasma sp. TIUS-1]
MKLINGTELSNKLNEENRIEVLKFKRKPKLQIYQVGDDFSSNKYIKYKQKKAKDLGIEFELLRFKNNVLEEVVIEQINKSNNDDSVTAIIVQLPIPKHINQINIIKAIDPIKDADGFTPVAMGETVLGLPINPPATPKGIMKLIEGEKINLIGSDVVIIGRSNIVGKPLANMLINKQATVTICNTKTNNLDTHIKNAEIIIAAAGSPNLINKNNIGHNQIVIDVGSNYVNGKYCGDANFDEIKNEVSLITPVPGGVGPMTIWALFDNVIQLYKLQNKNNT